MNIYGKQQLLSFNGTSTYIDCGAKVEFAFTERFTLETWIRPLNGNSTQAFIFSHSHGDFDLKIYQRYLYFGNLKSKTQLTLDKWVHVAITFDIAARDQKLKMYLNGKLDQTQDRTHAFNGLGTHKVLIGRKESHPDRNFQGDMASFALWNRLRTGLEIKRGMHDLPHADTKGLLAFWNMDEGSGKTLNDLSKNRFNASLKGTVKWQQVEEHEQALRHDYSMHTSKYGYVLNFIGQGNYLDCGKDSAFLLPDALTIEAWVRPTQFGRFESMILSHNNTDYEFNFKSTELILGIQHGHRFYDEFKKNKWIHFAASFNSQISQKQVKLYVNGVMVKAYNRSGKLNANPDHPLTIGARPGWDWNTYQGEMAGVSLWSRERTVEEIKKGMYQLPLAGEQGLVACWPMTEGHGSVIHDISGNNHHAKVVGKVNWRRVETAKEPPKPIPKDPKLPLTSVSGHNGEIHKLLNRVQQHHDGIIKQKRQAGNHRRKIAHELARNQINQAHTEAAKKVNSTRFNFLYFLSDGKINRIDPKGKAIYDLPNAISQTFTVDPTKMTHATGIQVNPGDRITVSYQSGTWGVSPLARNLTAAGSSQYIAKDRYALPGAPEGALLGYLQGFFLIGMGRSFIAQHAGVLELATNDEFSPSNPEDTGKPYEDNTGSIQVEIIKTPAQPNAHSFIKDLVIDPAAQKIYIAQIKPPYSIQSFTLEGQERTNKFTHASPPISLALDTANKKMYWIEENGNIRVGSLDGSVASMGTRIYKSGISSDESHIVLDSTADRLYFCQEGRIASVKTDGSDYKIIIGAKDAPYPIGLAVDNQHIYWLDKKLQVLRKSDLNGQNIIDLFPVLNPEPGLTLDHPAATDNKHLQEVYWSEKQVKLSPHTPDLVLYLPMKRTETHKMPNEINKTILADLHDTTWSSIKDDRFQHLSDTSMVFNGKTSFVKISDHAPFRIKQYTVEIWIKPYKNKATPTPEWQGIVGKPGRNFNIWLHRDGFIHHRFAITGNTNEGAPNTSSNSIKWNEWNHVAISNDGSAAKTYINGKLEAQGPVAAKLEVSPGPIVLGQDLDQGHQVENYKFRGEMAELRIWKRARSIKEIQGNLLKYSQIHMVRGNVDGSGHIERLFDIPSNGSLSIYSKQSAGHERQATAYRTLKLNREHAHKQIQDTQTEQDNLVYQKHDELTETRKTQHEAVHKKRMDQEQKRAENKQNLHQAKNDANQRVAYAQTAASNKRKHAHSQADSIKNNAHSKGHTIKSHAKDKRDKAQKKKDTY